MGNGASAQRNRAAVWEANGGMNGLRCCGCYEEDNKVIMGRLRIDIELGEGVRRKERWRRRKRRGWGYSGCRNLLESPSRHGS